MANEPRLFRKHANRRLYDIKRKRYVSLDEIRKLICKGIDVRVEDSQNRDDITGPILLQIIAECEQDGRPLLSSGLLTSLIRHYGHPMQDFVGPFLEESLAFFTRQEARIRSTISSLTHIDGRESLSMMRDRLAKILGVDKPE